MCLLFVKQNIAYTGCPVKNGAHFQSCLWKGNFTFHPGELFFWQENFISVAMIPKFCHMTAQWAI